MAPWASPTSGWRARRPGCRDSCRAPIRARSSGPRRSARRAREASRRNSATSAVLPIPDAPWMATTAACPPRAAASRLAARTASSSGSDPRSTCPMLAGLDPDSTRASRRCSTRSPLGRSAAGSALQKIRAERVRGRVAGSDGSADSCSDRIPAIGRSGTRPVERLVEHDADVVPVARRRQLAAPAAARGTYRLECPRRRCPDRPGSDARRSSTRPKSRITTRPP